jgi:hypothetical protein
MVTDPTCLTADDVNAELKTLLSKSRRDFPVVTFHDSFSSVLKMQESFLAGTEFFIHQLDFETNHKAGDIEKWKQRSLDLEKQIAAINESLIAQKSLHKRELADRDTKIAEKDREIRKLRELLTTEAQKYKGSSGLSLPSSKCGSLSRGSTNNFDDTRGEYLTRGNRQETIPFHNYIRKKTETALVNEMNIKNLHQQPILGQRLSSSSFSSGSVPQRRHQY